MLNIFITVIVCCLLWGCVYCLMLRHFMLTNERLERENEHLVHETSVLQHKNTILNTDKVKTMDRLKSAQAQRDYWINKSHNENRANALLKDEVTAYARVNDELVLQLCERELNATVLSIVPTSEQDQLWLDRELDMDQA